MLVIGDREAEAGAVSVRNRRHGDQGVRPVEDFVSDIARLVREKTPFE
jgi:threonyl-tRNA synthetase